MRHDRELAHHQRFVADSTAARSARRTLAMFTPELGSDVVQTLQLLVTELVGDAVTHAEQDIVELDLSVTPGYVRLTVSDAGPGFESRVSSTTERWGTRSDGQDRVWVEIDRARHAARCAAQPIRSRRPAARARPRRGGRS